MKPHHLLPLLILPACSPDHSPTPAERTATATERIADQLHRNAILTDAAARGTTAADALKRLQIRHDDLTTQLSQATRHHATLTPGTPEATHLHAEITTLTKTLTDLTTQIQQLLSTP